MHQLLDNHSLVQNCSSCIRNRIPVVSIYFLSMNIYGAHKALSSFQFPKHNAPISVALHHTEHIRVVGIARKLLLQCSLGALRLVHNQFSYINL